MQKVNLFVTLVDLLNVLLYFVSCYRESSAFGGGAAYRIQKRRAWPKRLMIL